MILSAVYQLYDAYCILNDIQIDVLHQRRGSWPIKDIPIVTEFNRTTSLLSYRHCDKIWMEIKQEISFLRALILRFGDDRLRDLVI